MKKVVIILLLIGFLIGLGLIIFKYRDNKLISTTLPSVNLRLQWIPQAQFAGYIIAKEKGFYTKQGLNVNILPAGPDLKSQTTVASGSDQFGIGVPNQIIAARSNGVPLVTIAQIFQDSPNRYVLKQQNAINSLLELKGKNVGLWLGGDEAEFVSMLNTVGMTLSDINIIPQEFSVAPFLQDKYILSMVTVYNELHLIEEEGYKDKLQILSPKDYASAIPGDMIFTTTDYLNKNPEIVKKFLAASIEGWQYCIQHPDEALDIILKANPDLDRSDQNYMLRAAIRLIKSGEALSKGVGYINKSDYENTQRILLLSKQINHPVDINATFNDQILNSISSDLRTIN